VIRFLGGWITFVDRTETERTAYEYRVSLRHVERTQQNPYGLVVSSVEQAEIAPTSQSKRLTHPGGIPVWPRVLLAERKAESGQPADIVVWSEKLVA